MEKWVPANAEDMYGHQWADVRDAYPLPARLVKEMEERLDAFYRNQRAIRRFALPILGVASVGFWTAEILTKSNANVLALLAILATTCFLVALALLAAHATRNTDTNEFTPLLHLESGGPWRTLRKVLETASPKSPLLPNYLESALSLDESRNRVLAINEDLSERTAESHPPEILRQIIENKRQMMHDESDSAIKRLLHRQIERLEDQRHLTRTADHMVESVAFHLAQIDKAEARLISLIREQQELFELDDAMTHSYRDAIPSIASPVSESELKIHAGLAAMPEAD